MKSSNYFIFCSCTFSIFELQTAWKQTVNMKGREGQVLTIRLWLPSLPGLSRQPVKRLCQCGKEWKVSRTKLEWLHLTNVTWIHYPFSPLVITWFCFTFVLGDHKLPNQACSCKGQSGRDEPTTPPHAFSTPSHCLAAVDQCCIALLYWHVQLTLLHMHKIIK